jgi:hypothetical protein
MKRVNALKIGGKEQINAQMSVQMRINVWKPRKMSEYLRRNSANEQAKRKKCAQKPIRM